MNIRGTSENVKLHGESRLGAFGPHWCLCHAAAGYKGGPPGSQAGGYYDMVKRGGPTAEEFLTGMLVSAGGRITSPHVILAWDESNSRAHTSHTQRTVQLFTQRPNIIQAKKKKVRWIKEVSTWKRESQNNRAIASSALALYQSKKKNCDVRKLKTGMIIWGWNAKATQPWKDGRTDGRPVFLSRKTHNLVHPAEESAFQPGAAALGSPPRQKKVPAVSTQGPKCDSLRRMMCMWRCESPRKNPPDRIVTLMMQAAHAQNPRVMRKGKKTETKKTNRTDLMGEHESAGECKLLQASSFSPPNYDQENHREEKRNR